MPREKQKRIKEQFRHFVTHEVAGLCELLAPATMDEDDFLAYAHLPYRSRQYAGPGWMLVGDAGSFMDPYYSPGLDHASMSAGNHYVSLDGLGRDGRPLPSGVYYYKIDSPEGLTSGKFTILR